MGNCTNCGKSITLPSSLVKGDDGKSIIWKGQSASFLSNPSDLWAFYHTGNNISYIYNATSGQWEVLAKDGTDGDSEASTKMLGNNSTAVSHALTDSGSTSGNRSMNFSPGMENFTDDSLIEIKALVRMDDDSATGSPNRIVKLAIGNTSNPSSATVLGTFEDNTTDELYIELTSRLNLFDVSASSNNVLNIFEAKVQNAPSNYYQNFNVSTIDLDLTSTIYIFTICEITGTSISADFTDYNQLVTRLLAPSN